MRQRKTSLKKGKGGERAKGSLHEMGAAALASPNGGEKKTTGGTGRVRAHQQALVIIEKAAKAAVQEKKKNKKRRQKIFEPPTLKIDRSSQLFGAVLTKGGGKKGGEQGQGGKIRKRDNKYNLTKCLREKSNCPVG